MGRLLTVCRGTDKIDNSEKQGELKTSTAQTGLDCKGGEKVWTGVVLEKASEQR
jgi:hypothetical protein